MTIYQWLCLFSVPALIAGAFRFLHVQIKRNREENREETKAVKLGIQALLRGQMIAEYNKWSERGYAPIYAKENFENCWQQYHSLGANGVMDGIHTKFMQLPDRQPVIKK